VCAVQPLAIHQAKNCCLVVNLGALSSLRCVDGPLLYARLWLFVVHGHCTLYMMSGGVCATVPTCLLDALIVDAPSHMRTNTRAHIRTHVYTRARAHTQTFTYRNTRDRSLCLALAALRA